MQRTTLLWLLVGVLGYSLLPWYMVEGGFWSFGWLSDPFTTGASALVWALSGRNWLWLPLFGFIAATVVLLRCAPPTQTARGMVISGAVGLALMAAQGVLIVGQGTRFGFLPEASQQGMGAGAFVTAAALLFVMTTGISGLGRGRGDAFITGMIGAIVHWSAFLFSIRCLSS